MRYSKWYLVLSVWLVVALAACGKHESDSSGYLRASDVYQGQKDALVAAIDAGDVTTVEMLLGKGVQVNSRLSSGRTLLIHAAIQPQVRVVNLLLKRGADPKLKDNDGRTALDHARIHGDPRALLLLDPEEQVLAQVRLINAIKEGRDINIPLREGIDPNFTDTENQGESPLTLAIELRRNLAARILARWKDPLAITSTDVNMPNQAGMRPLAKAKITNQSNLVTLLESLGAKE